MVIVDGEGDNQEVVVNPQLLQVFGGETLMDNLGVQLPHLIIMIGLMS